MSDTFDYRSAPSIASVMGKDDESGDYTVTPAEALIVDTVYDRHRQLEILGEDFYAGARVFLSASGVRIATCLAVDVLDIHTIHCKVPSFPDLALPLLCVLEVENLDRVSAFSTDTFEYLLSVPAIADVTPAAGSARGHRTVILTGEDFYPGLNITFDGTYASEIFLVGEAEILTSSVANPSIIATASPHGLLAGETVEIAGHAGSTPDINGARVATILDDTHFSIPVNVTAGGSGGTVSIPAGTRVILKSPAHGGGGPSVIHLENVDRQFAEADYLFVYPDDALVITNIGPIRRESDAIAITDALNDAANTCNLTVGEADETPGTAPEAGQDTEITVNGVLVFGGTILTVTQIYEELTSQLKWKCDLTDFAWELNGIRPFEVYTASSASAIIADLIATYAPGFTGTHVAAGLPSLSITFDGSLDLMACIVAIMAQVNGYAYVDYVRDIHAFITPEAGENPDDIDDANLLLLRDPPATLTTDISQVRNRVFVKWAGGITQRDSIASQTALGFTRSETISAPATADTLAKAQAFGDQWLAKFAKPAIYVNYGTRDLLTRSGRKVTWNLTNPPIVGDFLIQNVQISQIHVDEENAPVCTVKAALITSPVTKFDFLDLLRKVVLVPSGVGSIAIGGGSSLTAGDGIDITADVASVKLDGASLAVSGAGLKISEPLIQADGGQAFTADQPFGGHKATGLGAPTPASSDAATALYAESLATAAAASAPGTAHNLLSARHGDTSPASPALGALVAGDGADWVRLLPGADGSLLAADSGAAEGVAWVPLETDASARAFRATAQTITVAVETAIAFSAVSFDTDSFWSSGAPSHLVIPTGKGGRYTVVGQVAFTIFAGAATVILRLYRNSTLIAEQQFSTTNLTPALQIATIAELDDADVLELRALTADVAGTHDTVGGSAETYLALSLAAGTVGAGGGGGGSAPVWIFDEVPDGDLDGMNRSFASAAPFVFLIVYLNGLEQKEGQDYGLADSQHFYFYLAPAADDFVSITYQEA